MNFEQKAERAGASVRTVAQQSRPPTVESFQQIRKPWRGGAALALAAFMVALIVFGGVAIWRSVVPAQEQVLADPAPTSLADPVPDSLADPVPDSLADPVPDSLADPAPDGLVDPTSTAELSLAVRTPTSGLSMVVSGSLMSMDYDELPAASVAAIEVIVIDVRPSIPNTRNGEFPPIDLNGSFDQLRGLYPLTRVEVQIVDVLGGQLDSSVGDRVDITIAGGVITTTLTPQEARILGFEGAEIDDAALAAPHDHDPDAEPTPEPEIDLNAPVPLSIGIAPSVRLTEGDRVVLFVVQRDSQIFGSAGTRSVLAITHPVGVYRQYAQGWASDFGESDAYVDVRALAALIEP